MKKFKLIEPSIRFSGFKSFKEKRIESVLYLNKKKIKPNSNISCKDIELDSIESNTGKLLSIYSIADFDSTKNYFSSDSVLFGKLRPYLRKFYLPDFEGACSSEIWVIESDKLCREYTYYFVQSNYFNFLCNQTCGTKMPRADWKVLNQFSMFIPDNKEQQKIAKLFTMLDKKINILERKLEIIGKYHYAIVCKLFSSPTSKGTFGDYVVEQKKTGLPASAGNESGNYPFFINSAKGNIRYIDEHKFDGEYLILNTGGSAYTNYYSGKFSAMSDCLVLKPIADPFGLYYFLKKNESKINGVGFRGTGLKHLDIDWLYENDLIIPSIGEETLKRLFLSFNKMTMNLKSQIYEIRYYKTHLLNKMFPKLERVIGQSNNEK